MFGYDRDDLVGRSVETLVPESFWKVSTRRTGDDVLVIAAVRDVTEARKAAENARSLAAAEKLVRTVMASASMGIALAHLDGSFRVVNRSLCDLLGYDSEPDPARLPGMSVPRVGVQGRSSPRSG